MLRYRIVKQMLRNMVAAYPLGSRIPSRTALCLRFDTSRMTLDKAIAELEKEKVLYSVKGSGTYVGLPDRVREEDSSPNWCLLTPDGLSPHWNELAEGVLEFASQRGIELVRCNTEDSVERLAELTGEAAERGTGGILMVPPAVCSADDHMRLTRIVADLKIPLAFCGRDVGGIDVPLVRASHFYTGYAGTKHLLARGRRHIAYAADMRCSTTLEQCEGCLAAIAEVGEGSVRSYMPGRNVRGRGERIAERVRMILDDDPELDAIIFCGDGDAELYDAIRSRGKCPGEDVALLATEDSPAFSELAPALSAFRTDGRTEGRVAAEILQRTIHHQPIAGGGRSFTLPFLVERESCPMKKT